MDSVNKEQVNHPSHYNQGKIEVIAVIDDWHLDFSLGNVVKYLARAGHKSDNISEDLSKALWYLNHHINLISNNIDNAILYTDIMYDQKLIFADWNIKPDSITEKILDRIYNAIISKNAFIYGVLMLDAKEVLKNYIVELSKKGA